VDTLTQAQGIPRARTLVAFAGEDLDTFFHSYYLHASLPDVAEGDVLARWGRPFVVPLLQFADGRERYGVVHLDQARFRYFEVSFGEIEELHDAFRPLDPGHWRESSEAKVGVAPGIPARGGMGKDRFVRRKDAWTHRFYKEVEQLLERAVSKSGVDHLVVLGPAKYLQDFISVLGAALAEKVVACLPPPANPNASANDILERVAPRIADETAAQARALVDHLADSGERGIEATLEALQEGRLSLVAAVLHLDRTVYVCSESSHVSTTLSDRGRCPGQQRRLELLQELLPDLVQRHGARLTYLHGEAGSRLEEELGGLAGLKRW
jgi:peptide subunit release factor 1 (eRF1)